MNTKSNLIERYNASERINHWSVAISFILATLGGLALFHPALFWLTDLFGGGPWTRILHPYIGVVMFVFFVPLAWRFWKHNHVTAADRQWMGQLGDVLNKREGKLPEVGRYNAGQKYLFKLMVICTLLLLLTGIVMWQPLFAPYFSITLVRWAVVIHALSAFLIILGIIVHVYAAIWVKGSVRAMTRGTVTRAWARKHHPAWYREVSKGN